MKLRYFELDRPYVENRQRIEELMDSASLRYEEARIEDYNQNWKCYRKAFVYESKCMTSMLERLFKPVPTKDCWKIIIECMDKVCNPCIINLLGVYTVQVPFDFCTYEALDPVDKKKMLLAALVEGANRVFHKLSIPFCLLGDVVNEIERNHYENSWVWKKKKIQSTTFPFKWNIRSIKLTCFGILKIKTRVFVT